MINVSALKKGNIVKIMSINKINKLLDQWLKSREVILAELNSRNDLDIKTVIMKGKQLEDLNAKITVLVMVKSDYF